MIIKPYDIKDYPNIIKQIKTYFSKHIDITKLSNYSLSLSNTKKQERDVWQRMYWEHTKGEKIAPYMLNPVFEKIKNLHLVKLNVAERTILEPFVLEDLYNTILEKPIENFVDVLEMIKEAV